MATKKKYLLKFGLLTKDRRNAEFLGHLWNDWAEDCERTEKPFGTINKLKYVIPKEFMSESERKSAKEPTAVTVMIYEFKAKDQLVANVELLQSLDFILVVLDDLMASNEKDASGIDSELKKKKNTFFSTKAQNIIYDICMYGIGILYSLVQESLFKRINCQRILDTKLLFLADITSIRRANSTIKAGKEVIDRSLVITF
ncbi:hypothetical protein RFI_27786, partial [Reticulomyxa filosa]